MALPSVLPPEFAQHNSALKFSFRNDIAEDVRLGSIIRVSLEAAALSGETLSRNLQHPDTAWRRFVKEHPEYKDALKPGKWLCIDVGKQFAAWFIAHSREQPQQENMIATRGAKTEKTTTGKKRALKEVTNTSTTSDASKKVTAVAVSTELPTGDRRLAEPTRKFLEELNLFKSSLEVSQRFMPQGQRCPREDFVAQLTEILYGYDVAVLIPHADALLELVTRFCPEALQAINWVHVFRINRPQMVAPSSGDLIKLCG